MTHRSKITAHNSEVLGYRVKPRQIVWKGLRWDHPDCEVCIQSSLMRMLVGNDAPRDLHVSVPFIHPSDWPIYDGCRYRVRPHPRDEHRTVFAEHVDGVWYWVRA